MSHVTDLLRDLKVQLALSEKQDLFSKWKSNFVVLAK